PILPSIGDGSASPSCSFPCMTWSAVERGTSLPGGVSVLSIHLTSREHRFEHCTMHIDENLPRSPIRLPLSPTDIDVHRRTFPIATVRWSNIMHSRLRSPKPLHNNHRPQKEAK